MKNSIRRTRRYFPASASFTVVITGLDGNTAVIGSEGSIGYTIDPDNATETVKWSNSSNPADAATYGTGANPTSLAAGAGTTLYLHVTDGGETVTRAASILQITLTVDNTSETPDITYSDTTPASATVEFTIGVTTYTTDTDGTGLTIGGIETAPMCIIKPTISGTEEEGETLTAEAGYYLYAGDENITITREWQNDTDGALGDTDFSYTIQAGDVGDTISIDETISGDGAGFSDFVIASDSTGTIAGSVSTVTIDAEVYESTYFASPSDSSTSTDYVDTLDLGTAADDREFFMTVSGDVNNVSEIMTLDVGGENAVLIGEVVRAGTGNRASSRLFYLKSDDVGGSETVTADFGGATRAAIVLSGIAVRNAGSKTVYEPTYADPTDVTIETFADGAVFAAGSTQFGPTTWTGLTEVTPEGDDQIGGSAATAFVAAKDESPSDNAALYIEADNGSGGTAYTVISMGPPDVTTRVSVNRRWYASNYTASAGIADTSASDTVSVNLGTAKVGRSFIVFASTILGSGEPTLTIDGVSATAVQNMDTSGSAHTKAFYLDSDTIGGTVDIVSDNWTGRREVAYSIFEVENRGTVTAYVGSGSSGGAATNTSVSHSINGAFLLGGMVLNAPGIPTATGIHKQYSADIRSDDHHFEAAELFTDSAIDQTVTVTPASGSGTTIWVGLDIAPAGALDSLADLFTTEEGFAYEATLNNTYEDLSATDPAEVGDNVRAFESAVNGHDFVGASGSVNTLIDTGSGGQRYRINSNGTNSKLSKSSINFAGENGIGLLFYGQIHTFRAEDILIAGDRQSAAVWERFFQFRLAGNSGSDVGLHVIAFDGAGNDFGHVTATDAVPMNTDVLLMANITTSVIEIFYNGVSIASAPNTAGTLNGPGPQEFSIGSRIDATNTLDGEINSVAVRNAPWTTDEISDIATYFGVDIAPAGWEPTDEVSLRAWYDMSDTSTITDSGGAITAVSDKSGNGYTLTASGAQSPTKNGGTIGGVDVVSFSTDDQLNTTSFSLSGASDLCVVGMFTMSSTADDFSRITTIWGGSLDTDSANDWIAIYRRNIPSTLNCTTYLAGTGTFTESDISGFDTPTIVANSINNGTGILEQRFDGTSMGTVSGSALTMTSTKLNIGGYNGGDYLDGLIGDIIIFDSADTTLLQKAEGYLAHKYGQAANLPADHPYKLARP